MPAKSFLGSLETETRHFYATVMRHEINDATPELHEEAEDSLWAAMAISFAFNQVIAAPE